MSASSPAIIIEARAEPESIQASLRRLYFRRQLFRAIAKGTFSLACALAALFVEALIDFAWPLSRATRVAALVFVLAAALFLLAQAVWVLFRRRGLAAIAREVERAATSNNNALVTFAENYESARTFVSQPYMLARLEGQARLELEELDERKIAPRERATHGVIALAFIVLLLIFSHLVAPLVFAREVKRVLWPASDEAISESVVSRAGAAADGANAPIVVDELRLRVHPPAYSGLSVEEIAGDAPLRALSGSQIEVELHATGKVEDAQLSFNGATSSMRALGMGRFSGTFMVSASGAFEARIVADEILAPAPIVRAVEVYTDAPPEAHIAEPASDQLLRSVPDHTMALRWTARDDLGLAGAALKYIKSRGEGDAAKFTNGEVSIGNIERAGNREWRGTTALDLRRLDMQPGDTLVLWVEARDRNPSANNTGRSASVAIAIAAPELAKLNLSDLMPTEIGRFLLSQRQIIILTEKLHSERSRLGKDEFKRRSNDIAVEQREFKNSFNDYIEFEGEEEASPGSVEEQVRASEDERLAPHFHGIPEPPAGAPTSVREMTYAIRAMWDAEEALVNADTALALKHEREALVRLKRAQSAVRYVPPIVAQSKPIDLKRRYAGELAEIKIRLERLARRGNSRAESAPVRAALAEAYAALNDLQETLNVSASVRMSAVGRARERARRAADNLLSVRAGNHAATIAEAAGQFRIVEMELARVEVGGTADEYAARISKPLALLAQASSNLFAIAESSTRAVGGDANNLLPTNDARAAEYFRRLAGGSQR
jgi:hypothetical protein